MHLTAKDPTLSGTNFFLSGSLNENIDRGMIPEFRDHRTGKQLLLAMKLTAILLFIVCMNVSAIGFGQQVTLNVKNAPLKTVFLELNKQTGYNFLYNDEVLKEATPVTLNVKDKQLSDVLALCFKDQPLSFSLENTSIVVKKKTEAPVVILNASEGPQAPLIDVHGRVVNEKGEPVPGATVTVKGSRNATATDSDGNFILTGVEENATLVISAVNIDSREIKVKGNTDQGSLVVKIKIISDEDVSVEVNTGYQSIPKERATGSFTSISKKLFNEQSGSTVTARLEAITNGLYFDRSRPTSTNIVIRGMSTILGPRAPLIILNNFPYNGNLDDINPNDVESITVLKDAAAASIWGTQAGNGVIVITTKKAKLNQRTSGSFSSTVLATNRPDLSNIKTFSPEDNISLERYLFTKGAYNSQLNNSPWLWRSPVVEILWQQKKGFLTGAEADAQIAAIGQHDIRDDFKKYVYTKGMNYQQALSLQGGSQAIGWTLNAGWDHNEGVLRDQYERITLRSAQLYRISQKLELTTGLDYTQSTAKTGEQGYGTLKTVNGQLPIYTRLADDSGKALPTGYQFNKAYTDTVSGGRLLDWGSYPLTGWKHDQTTTKLQAILLNIDATYTLFPGLSLTGQYQYGRQLTSGRRLADDQSYFARDLINGFTTKIPATGGLVYPVPNGGILDLSNISVETQNLRGQFNFTKSRGMHELTAIAGAEIRQVENGSNYFRQYGFDPEILTSSPVDYITMFPQFLTGNSMFIPALSSVSSGINRFVSFYANAAYTLKSQFTLSGSARRDASNLFGVTTNNKWSPLWSTGLAWDLTKASFFNSAWGSQFKFRASYGASGNADPSRSAVTTLLYGLNSTYTQQPSARISQFQNSNLSWERVNILNMGVDYSTRNHRIWGTVEYYAKKGVNLFGPQPEDYTAVSTSSLVVNIASIAGHGWDISLQSLNIKGLFSWTSQLNLNFNRDKVLSNNLSSRQGSSYAGTGTYGVPGQAVAALYAYRWAGLDSLTGDPQGYFNGKVSKDYVSLTGSATTVDDLKYIGSAQPRSTFSLGNTLRYKNLSLTFRITGKLGYYFLRTSLDYGSLFKGASNSADYTLRWQKAGDEKWTNVPSLVYPANTKRDNFYRFSEVLFSRADQVRLQYVTLSYDFAKPSIQVYVNANNLGLLWVANRYHIDPDYNNTLAVPRNIALGLKLHF